MRRPNGWLPLATGLAVLLFAGCVSKVESVPAVSPGPQRPEPTVAGALVIEQFLRAVNAYDLDTMARLHGTVNGPIAGLYPAAEVRDRMRVMAEILKHEDYSILRTEIVPGRRDEASAVIVKMAVGGRDIEVPYTLVWTHSRNWLIEKVDLEKVTGR
jgi:hypothetical protein